MVVFSPKRAIPNGRVTSRHLEQSQWLALKMAAVFTLTRAQRPRQRGCSASFFEEPRLSGLKSAILAAGRNSGAFFSALHAAGCQTGVQAGLGVVVRRHLAKFPAFFVQPNPAAFAVLVIVFHLLRLQCARSRRGLIGSPATFLKNVSLRHYMHN